MSFLRLMKNIAHAKTAVYKEKSYRIVRHRITFKLGRSEIHFHQGQTQIALMIDSHDGSHNMLFKVAI